MRSTLLEDEPAVEETNDEERENEVEEVITKEDEEEEETDEHNETNEDEKEDEDSPKKQKSSRWWLWLLIILLILVVVGIIGYLFRDKLSATIERIKEKREPTEQLVEIGEEEEDAMEEETYSIEEMEEEEAPVDAEPYTPQVVKSTGDNKYSYIRFEQGHFYVIAGSLPNEHDAELHIRQRGLDRYQPTLLLQDGVSNIRVCIGIFDSEEEADQFAQSTNANYWILK